METIQHEPTWEEVHALESRIPLADERRVPNVTHPPIRCSACGQAFDRSESLGWDLAEPLCRRCWHDFGCAEWNRKNAKPKVAS